MEHTANEHIRWGGVRCSRGSRTSKQADKASKEAMHLEEEASNEEERVKREGGKRRQEQEVKVKNCCFNFHKF